MLGWEFPPHISGGLGTACHGIVSGLGKIPDTKVIFVVPKVFGDEKAGNAVFAGANKYLERHSTIQNRRVRAVVPIQDQPLIYVETASMLHPYMQAEQIEKINRQLLDEGRRCIYVGPGRWGSSDPWLGIPVKWPHISAARIIVEAGLNNFQVDPSQGTHFFQNLTSLGVSYFTINAFRGDGIYDEKRLAELPAVAETQYVRHVRLQKPLTVKVDGIHREGVILE